MEIALWKWSADVQRIYIKDQAEALEGESIALRLFMEYRAPTPKDNPVSFALPQIKTHQKPQEAFLQQ